MLFQSKFKNKKDMEEGHSWLSVGIDMNKKLDAVVIHWGLETVTAA